MEQSYFTMEGDIAVPTEAGLEYLAKITTDPKGQVYAFTRDAEPLMVAGAMARLSRTGDDMRMVVLKEFAGRAPEALNGLFRRVITGYGDDSVQQLMPMSLVVESCSNLMTKLLERGRLKAYLEQSTRYIYFDAKVYDRNGELVYRYYIPMYFPEPLRNRYRADMDHIFALYSKVVRELSTFVRERKVPFQTSETDDAKIKAARTAWMGATRAQACDAARNMLPVATTSTVGIVGSAQSFDTLIMRLASLELPEAQELSERLLGEVRKVAPQFFERTDIPERGGATINHRRQIIQNVRAYALEHLSPEEVVASGMEINLVDYYPKDELSVICDLLWNGSGESYESIARQVAGLGEEGLVKILQAGIGERYNRRHRPGRSFEFAHFKWECKTDYGIFRDLQRHRLVDGLDWQDLTPFLGYEVPPLVVEAGLEGVFREAFEASERLYREVSSSGFKQEAQYTTLLGHHMRWRLAMNVRESFHFHEIRTGLDGHPGYRKAVKLMNRKFGDVYPRIGSAMKFVDTREDPELTRIAGELATQAKLALLTGD